MRWNPYAKKVPREMIIHEIFYRMQNNREKTK